MRTDASAMSMRSVVIARVSANRLAVLGLALVPVCTFAQQERAADAGSSSPALVEVIVTA